VAMMPQEPKIEQRSKKPLCLWPNPYLFIRNP